MYGMVWYYVLIGLAVSVVVGLLIPYIRRRYIDVEMVRCVVCGTAYKEYGKCPKCGGR